jgi:hypothetical protein
MVALLFNSLRIRRRQGAFSHDGNQFPDRFCRLPNFEATSQLLTNANAVAWQAATLVRRSTFHRNEEVEVV